MANEEKKVAFSFNKLKKPSLASTITSTSSNGGGVSSAVKFAFDSKSKVNKKGSKKNSESESDEEEIDLITEISDKKVKSTKPREEKKVPIIELKGSKRSAEDMDAIKALIEEATNKKLSKKNSSDLKIGISEAKVDKEEEDAGEDPDYEQVQLEDFGLACLRGMGWNEKECGIGKNKQIVKMSDIELRPRGLGLGASLNKKKNDTTEEGSSEENSKLVYAKGAYLEILDGKHAQKYAQLVSFDDGLNRIMIKIIDTDETISILQSSTKLVSKSKISKHSSSRR